MVDLTDTYVENRFRVQPNHANNYGTAHGGHVMKWMDEVGAMSAMRFAGETCLTASIDRMDFLRPIPTGDTVLLRSYVYDAGRTSVRVFLRAFREDPRSGDTELTTESRFVFVAVDESGTPVEVPALDAPTDRERDLRERALADETGGE